APGLEAAADSALHPLPSAATRWGMITTQRLSLWDASCSVGAATHERVMPKLRRRVSYGSPRGSQGFPTQERAAVPTSPDLGVSLELFPKNPPLKHVWYAEPTARAACALILGSNHRARRYQRGCWGNTLSPSLEVSAEQRSKWAGMEEITKCSQPHRKPDGPERCMIKGSEVTDFSGKVHFSSTLKQ
ncbi:hypothetical protein KUCAC02_023827, partial [Chaenocephalus aceratus]